MGIFSRNRDGGYSGASWHIQSAIDPRWNRSGHAFGMWHAIAEVEKAVAEARTTLGPPPADLEYGFNKP